MARVKRRDTTWTLTEVDGRQIYQGPGVLRYMKMDGTSLSSNVVTLYDSRRGSTSDPTVATITQDTDFGTVGPLATVYSNGRIEATAGTASENTHLGVPFADGLYAVKTGDTTHTAAFTFLISPLIKKSVTIQGRGTTTQDVPVFDGPGVLHGIVIRANTDGVTTTGDLLFKDSNTPGSGQTLWTATNYVTTSKAVLNASQTVGVDDAGVAVTTAATGAYANPGIPFANGLHIAAAQLQADITAYQIDVLIEA